MIPKTALKIIILLFLLFAGSGIVFAEPMPLRIAVNHETRQCAEFGCGDECSDCKLPEGWVVLGYSFNVACPADYEVVEIEVVWVPLANEFCCTSGHSGVPGDCRDVVTHPATRQCAFGRDVVNRCGSLPFGWQQHGSECSHPYEWAREIQCSPAPTSFFFHPGAAGGLSLPADLGRPGSGWVLVAAEDDFGMI
jgi:hypothetical protein